jgi:hypothetical protein
MFGQTWHATWHAHFIFWPKPARPHSCHTLEREREGQTEKELYLELLRMEWIGEAPRLSPWIVQRACHGFRVLGVINCEHEKYFHLLCLFSDSAEF